MKINVVRKLCLHYVGERLFFIDGHHRKILLNIEEGYRQKNRQRSSLLFGGKEFIQFLAALAILPRTILKNRINLSFSFKLSLCNSSYYSNRPGKNS